MNTEEEPREAYEKEDARLVPVTLANLAVVGVFVIIVACLFFLYRKEARVTAEPPVVSPPRMYELELLKGTTPAPK